MRKKSDHERTVARVRKSLAPLTPCIHVDADGYCTGCNVGALCVKCADYTAKTKKELRQSAVAVAEPAPIAQQLTTQYRAVVAATGQMLREAVKFGAMLMELETILGKSRAGRDSGGEGIKAWLAENCPEINYMTAMGYKRLATKSSIMIGAMGLQAVAALQGSEHVTKTNGEVIDVPAEIIERRDQLFEEVHSRRELEQAYFAFMAEEDKPKAKKAAKPLPKLSQREEAKAIWNGVMVALSKSSVRDAIPLLGEKETRVCHDGLRDLLSLLKKHLEEF